jgi:hypothetical protein
MEVIVNNSKEDIKHLSEMMEKEHLILLEDDQLLKIQQDFINSEYYEGANIIKNILLSRKK